MRNAGTTPLVALLWSILCASPALGDIPGCPKSDMPAAALKGLQKAARREHADPLDLSTLYYCARQDGARAIVDTLPVAQPDGSDGISTLMCSGSADRPRDWNCRIERYVAIRVSPGAGQSDVRVELGEHATLETTRDYAQSAFTLLNQQGRVDACPGTRGSAQTTEALRDLLVRRHGPYRLVISREGFALLRAGIQVRVRAANEFNPRAQLQCWEEHAVEQ